MIYVSAVALNLVDVKIIEKNYKYLGFNQHPTDNKKKKIIFVILILIMLLPMV
jgi:hypothetical protein